MKHDKIIDRIRKLLAMAGDTSSPNEAAIAAKRARKLMDEHQVSEMDLTTVTGDDFGTSAYAAGTKTAVTVLGRLAIPVAKLNDCQVAWVSGPDGRKQLEFQGFLADAVCAAEMFKWLRDTMYRQA